MPFKAGQSGNPHGRPKEDAEIKALAREAAPEAMQRLIQIMRGDDNKLAKAAADSVLDRAIGKPAQTVQGPDGRDLFHKILIEAVNP